LLCTFNVFDITSDEPVSNVTVSIVDSGISVVVEDGKAELLLDVAEFDIEVSGDRILP
jgi:hypothetical protein